MPQDDLTIHGFHKEIRGVHADTDTIDPAMNALGCVVHRVLMDEMPSQPGEILVMRSCVEPRASRVRRHGRGMGALHCWCVLGVEDPRNDPKMRHRPQWNVHQRMVALFEGSRRPALVLIRIPFDHIIDVADREGTLPPKAPGWSRL